MSRFKWWLLVILHISLVACGGGSHVGDSRPGGEVAGGVEGDGGEQGDGAGGEDLPDPAPPPLVLFNEKLEKEYYRLSAVNIENGFRTILDEGGKNPYYARLLGKKIVFGRVLRIRPDGSDEDIDLFSINLNGTGLQQLTNGPERDYFVDQVGNRFVFHRGVGFTIDVATMQQDGSDLQVLFGHPHRGEVVKKIVGDLLVIHSSNDLPRSDLFAVRADGSQAPHELAAADGVIEKFEAVVGDRIVFKLGKTEEEYRSVLLAGGGDALLFPAKTVITAPIAHGGRLFAGVKHTLPGGGTQTRIDSVNVDGTDRVENVPGSTRDAWPALFAGNRLIYYGKTATGKMQPFSANLDGSDILQLTFTDYLSHSDRVAGVAGDALIVLRYGPHEGDPFSVQSDLYLVGYTAASQGEKKIAEDANAWDQLVAVTRGRILHSRLDVSGRRDMYSVLLDGTEPRHLLPDQGSSVELLRVVGGASGERLIVRRSAMDSPDAADIIAIEPDGSDPVVLFSQTSGVELVSIFDLKQAP